MKIKKQTKFWKTKDGKKIRISDMTDSHLLNTIKFFQSRYETHLNTDYEDRAIGIKDKLPNIYFDLIDESERRKLCK